MSLLQRAGKTLAGMGLVVALPSLVLAQSTNSTNYYASQAAEYAPLAGLLGDQINPFLSLTTNGGFLVYQDNITDGDGLGISCVRLDSTLSPTLGIFRVNQQGAKDQENPQVAMLPGGAAAFVWQGGALSFQHIYARFLSSSNVWITGDVQVNTSTNFQVNPVVQALPNGNVVVSWGSFGQDNSDGLQGVYAQVLTSTGQKVGGEFRVNQFTPHNQRSPAIAAFPNGNFIVTWISEQERYSQTVGGSGLVSGGTYNSVDVYARIFNSSGTALGNEFLANAGTNVCANPAVAVASDSSYIIAWSQKDATNLNNGWDIFARSFGTNGVGGSVQLVNSQRFGDQYAPKIASLGSDYMVVWTSMGQDGSREGIFSQFLHKDGSHAGGEQLVNTTVLNQQIYPTVASDGTGRFLVAWSSFVSVANGMDLYAQRFTTTQAPLLAPAAPLITALDSYSLSVTWPALAGYPVSYYQLFVDGSTTPFIVTNNLWSGQNYNPASTHTYQLAYVLTDGRQSPASAIATGTTWGRDDNYDGLPDDWEAHYYGSNPANWPANGARTLLASGVTALQVFLWGADPTNPNTWLKQWISNTSQGYFLNWNTIPGGIYQVRTSTDLQNWSLVGSPRFEAGSTDSIYLGWTPGSYYQVMRNRY